MRRALLAILLVACGPKAPPAVPAPPPKIDEPVAVTPVVAPVAAKATRVRSVEGITEYTLANGLQILLFPDPTQSKFTVNVTYLVGSRHEGYGETGMAHLLEHMLFKGTKKLRDISTLLEARGGANNGSTWTDRTNYYETLNAQGDNLAWTIEMEADRMINSTVLAEDLATEFSVVRSELEIGENEPLAILNQRIVSMAYDWHNYAKDTIGARSDVEKVPVPALRAFYEKYYQPDNAVIVVAGKIDEPETLALIEKHFGGIPRPTRKLPPTYTIEQPQDGERAVTLRRNGDVYATGVAYHTVGAASPDFPAVLAALDLLDREPSGRLYKKLVATGLATSVGGGQEFFRDPWLATMYVELRDGKNIERVEKIVTDEFEKLGTSKIDERDVERWRVATLKSLELSFADSEGIAVELSEFAALGDWRAIFAYRDRVEKITAADVQRVAKTYFKPSNRTTGRFIPTKTPDRAPLTETPDIVAAVKGIEDRAVKDPGEPFAATLDNIEARTVRKALPSGLQTAVLAKKTRGAKVELSMMLRWGDEKTLQGKTITAAMTAALLQRGTTKKSFQELQDAENALKSQISISSSGPGGLFIQIETLRDKLPGALDLVAEMVRTPSFPASELALIKAEWLSALEKAASDPETLADNELARIASPWPKGHPLYPMSLAEKIAAVQKVTVADVRAFYTDFFGASFGEVAIVGDTDAEAITAHVEKRFGGWATKKPFTRIADKVFGVPGVTKTIDVKDKESSYLTMFFDVAMKDTDPDYAAWVMIGQVLGGDSGSRVWQRLREKGGMSYGAGAWTSAGVLDDAGGFGAWAQVAPQNLAKAKAALLDELAKIATTPIAKDELERSRSAWGKTLEASLSNDSYVTSMLLGQLFYKRTMANVADLQKRVAAVDGAAVDRVAKKYLAAPKLVIVDAGDTAKAKN